MPPVELLRAATVAHCLPQLLLWSVGAVLAWRRRKQLGHASIYAFCGCTILFLILSCDLILALFDAYPIPKTMLPMMPDGFVMEYGPWPRSLQALAYVLLIAAVVVGRGGHPPEPSSNTAIPPPPNR